MAEMSKLVYIGGKKFALDEIPNAKTALVTGAIDRFHNPEDLNEIVTDLSELENDIHVACNGVAVDTELKIAIKRTGYEIRKLADKSGKTVHSFQIKSRGDLQNLKRAYRYLLNGRKGKALVNLSGLALSAEETEMVSKELHEHFTNKGQIINKHRRRTSQLLKGFKEKINESEKQREEFEIQLKKAQQEKRYFEKAERKADKMYYEAQQRQDKAYVDHGGAMTTYTDQISKLAITSADIWAALSSNPQKSLLATSETGDKLFYKDVMYKACKEKRKHLNMAHKHQEMRRKANQQCIEFAERIKNCQRNIDNRKAVIDALNNSVVALESLYTTMMKAALFWEQMQTHCKALPGKDLQTQVKILKYDNAKNVCNFKTNAMNYCAKWVALVEVCDRYVQADQTNRT